MDRRRINELTTEYNEMLEEDLVYLKDLLKHVGVEELNGSATLEYQAREIANGTSEDELWMIHEFLMSLSALAPGFEQRIKDERGYESFNRLLWANSHEDDYYERYCDRLYDLPPGDYYITDPCYICEDSGLPWDERIWYAEDLSEWNIPTSFMRDTIFGDWGCSLIDRDTGEEMGAFGADTGMVVVAKKDEVLAANPNFEQWAKDHRWCVADLDDFEGTLTFKVDEDEYEWEGRMYKDYVLTLVFDGYDTETGNYKRCLAGMGVSSEE